MLVSKEAEEGSVFHVCFSGQEKPRFGDFCFQRIRVKGLEQTRQTQTLRLFQQRQELGVCPVLPAGALGKSVSDHTLDFQVLI